MNKAHEFYPMITGTMKSVLQLVDPMDMWEVMYVIISYPHHEIDGDLASKPIIDVVLNELDRQYTRWNKGGQK